MKNAIKNLIHHLLGAFDEIVGAAILCHIMLMRFGQIMQSSAQTNNVVTICILPAGLCEESGLLFVEIKEKIRFSSELHPSSCAFPQLSG